MLSFSSEKGYCKMDGIIGQWRHAWDLGSVQAETCLQNENLRPMKLVRVGATRSRREGELTP